MKGRREIDDLCVTETNCEHGTKEHYDDKNCEQETDFDLEKAEDAEMTKRFERK